MKRRWKLLLAAVTIVVLVGLVALIIPVVVPYLPSPAQVALGGTIHTDPGTVDELLQRTEVGPSAPADGRRVTHADVDAEYVTAASIWPWTLPPGWGFPKSRGAADTPGEHHRGMGVQAAFSKWAATSLEAVKDGDLDTDAADALLDEVEDATRTLLDVGVLSDRSFIEDAITPLRQ